MNVTEQHLDGFNMWPAITRGTSGPRKDILLQLDLLKYNNPNNPFIGQVAIREGNRN